MAAALGHDGRGAAAVLLAGTVDRVSPQHRFLRRGVVDLARRRHADPPADQRPEVDRGLLPSVPRRRGPPHRNRRHGGFSAPRDSSCASPDCWRSPLRFARNSTSMSSSATGSASPTARSRRQAGSPSPAKFKTTGRASMPSSKSAAASSATARPVASPSNCPRTPRSVSRFRSTVRTATA